MASPEWPTKYTDFQSWNLPKIHLCHYPLVYEPIKKNISVAYNIITVAINYLLCASSQSRVLNQQQQKIYDAGLQNTKDYTLHEFALCRSIRTKSRLYHYITSDVPNVAE